MFQFMPPELRDFGSLKITSVDVAAGELKIFNSLLAIFALSLI